MKPGTGKVVCVVSLAATFATAGCGMEAPSALSSNGSSCTDDSLCESEHCVAGTCCDSECPGPCRTCTDGACVPLAVGADCSSVLDGGSGYCNGAGVCMESLVSWPRVHNAGQCARDVDCESLACVSGLCCSEPCDGVCRSCTVPGLIGTCSNLPAGTSCSFGTDLAHTCDGVGNCLRAPNGGETCYADVDCLSLHCVAGTCCNDRCDTVCTTCSHPGAPGICVALSAGSTCSLGGTLGTCNGSAGGCVFN